MLHKYIFLLIYLLTASWLCQAQAIRKPGAPLNHPSLNYWSPFISFDGQKLLFLSDLNSEEFPTLYFTSKIGGDWKDPVLISSAVNARFNFQNGFSIAGDGKSIYVSLQRAGGLGGYDLIACDVKPEGIGTCTNPGVPINSKENDASLVFTPDGNTLYLMRCMRMNATSCSGCRILTAQKKPSGQWETPEELPENINQGNSQFPRIMSDGKTLIFASDQHVPNLGGMDLYMSRLENGHWTDPAPMTFINSSTDDLTVSATASGRYVMLSKRGLTKNEIIEVPFPSDLRPEAVLRINGLVNGISESAAYINVYDKYSGEKVYSTRTDNQQSFQLFLAAGSAYYLIIDPSDDHLNFDFRLVDLSKGPINVAEKFSFDVEPISVGGEVIVKGVEMDSLSSGLLPGSIQVLNRLFRLIQGNGQLNFTFDFSVEQNSDNPEVAEENVARASRLKDLTEAYFRNRNLKNLKGFMQQGRSDQVAGGQVLITLKVE
jgi:hypothetical protein